MAVILQLYAIVQQNFLNDGETQPLQRLPRDNSGEMQPFTYTYNSCRLSGTGWSKKHDRK